MNEITSSSNQRIKQILEWQKSAKARKESGIFIVEGKKMYTEAPKELISETYITEDMLDVIRDCNENVILIPDSLMTKISDTKSPQGILTVLKRLEYSSNDCISDCPLLLVIENLQDPGNLGTIIRMGEAAGVSGIIMSKDTVDIYNPKVVRSTMGSIFRVPFVIVDDIISTVEGLKSKGVNVYAAHLQGAEAYTEYDYCKPTAFLIGNEGKGLSDRLTSIADKKLFIPMEGSVESLNAGIAASILSYEAHRQRWIKLKKQ